MKKIKFIPILAVAALLSGCNSGGISVKAPKFAKEGEKVTDTKFMEDFSKAVKGLDIEQSPLEKLDSRVLSYSACASVDTSVKRGKKEIFKQSNKESVKSSYEFDSENLRVHFKEEDRFATSKKSVTQPEYKQEAKGVTERYYQKYEKDGKSYVVTVSPKEKTVTKYYELNEITTLLSVCNSYLAGAEEDAISFDVLYDLYTDWEDQSEATKSRYEFFENGTVYTWTYKYEVESNADKYNTKIVYAEKWQLDVNENNVNFRRSVESTHTYDYVKNYSTSNLTYQEGDQEVRVNKQYTDVSAKLKKVSVKEAKTAGYQERF